MAKGADIGSKRLISLAPDAWVRWLLNDEQVEALDFLSADFQWVSRESDVLLKARRPDVGEFLVLNEIQLRYNDTLPRRMTAYVALAEERYGLPVYPVLVNILEPLSHVHIPTQYRSEFLGLVAQRDYRVINLWEIEARHVLTDNLTPLLPFVPIMHGGQQEPILREALNQLRDQPVLTDMEPLLAFFASFVMNPEFITQLMRWDMAILKESPWYQEIVEQGRRQGAEESLRRLLAHRLGHIPDDIRISLQSLRVEQLQNLLDEAADVKNWAEFRAKLPGHINGA